MVKIITKNNDRRDASNLGVSGQEIKERFSAANGSSSRTDKKRLQGGFEKATNKFHIRHQPEVLDVKVAPVEKQTDEALMGLVQSGDQKAFGVLMERHRNYFLNRAKHVVHDQQNAEDVVQVAFLKLWQKSQSWRGDAKFKTWFHSVVHNEAFNFKRREHEKLSFDENDIPNSNNLSPDVVVQRQEEKSLFEKQFGSLENFITPKKARYKKSGPSISCVITYEDIIASAREEVLAKGRRPTMNDKEPIAYGPLAKTGLSWAKVNSALYFGRHSLPRGGSLSKFLNQYEIYPKAKFVAQAVKTKPVLQLSNAYKTQFCIPDTEIEYWDIIKSGWDEKQATGRRPVSCNSPIVYGPLKVSGFSWQQINTLLHRSGETLAKFFDKAGIPNGLTVTHEEIIASAWAQKMATGIRPVISSKKPIIYGPLARTGLSWLNVKTALCVGQHGLPGQEAPTQIFDEAGIPAGNKPVELKDLPHKVGGFVQNILQEGWEDFDSASHGYLLSGKLQHKEKAPVEFNYPDLAI